MIEVRQDSSLTALSRLGRASNALMAEIVETRWNYYLSYLTDGICPLLFFYLGLRSHLSWPVMIVATAAGAFFFTWAEYAIHRWLLHNPKNILFPLHATHHNQPEQPGAFLFPTSIVVLGLVWLIFVPMLHMAAASYVIAGFGAAYFYYGMLHHLEHHIKASRLPFRWMQKRWAAHTVHHHLDNTNFGVMTSFWDWIYGTHHKQVKLRKHQQA